MGASFKKKLIVTIAFAAALYLGGSVWVGWRDIAAAMGGFQWWVFPIALALAFANYAIRFAKWHYYLRLLNIGLEPGLSFKVFLAGMVMAATPGKFGEVFKSYLVKGINGAPMRTTAPIVLAERLTDFLAFLVLAMMGIALIPNGAPVFAVSLVLVAGIVALVSWKSAMEGILGFMERVPGVGSHTGKLRAAYESTHRLISPGPLAWATLISVVSWFFECLAFALVLWGFGHPVPLVAATFIYAFATIMGALLMTPGGVGPTEGALGGLLVLLQGTPEGVAASATIVIRVCTLWFAVLTGLFVLVVFHNAFGRADLAGFGRGGEREDCSPA